MKHFLFTLGLIGLFISTAFAQTPDRQGMPQKGIYFDWDTNLGAYQYRYNGYFTYNADSIWTGIAYVDTTTGDSISLRTREYTNDYMIQDEKSYERDSASGMLYKKEWFSRVLDDKGNATLFEYYNGINNAWVLNEQYSTLYTVSYDINNGNRVTEWEWFKQDNGQWKEYQLITNSYGADGHIDTIIYHDALAGGGYIPRVANVYQVSNNDRQITEVIQFYDSASGMYNAPFLQKDYFRKDTDPIDYTSTQGILPNTAYYDSIVKSNVGGGVFEKTIYQYYPDGREVSIEYESMGGNLIPISRRELYFPAEGDTFANSRFTYDTTSMQFVMTFSLTNSNDFDAQGKIVQGESWLYNTVSGLYDKSTLTLYSDYKVGITNINSISIPLIDVYPNPTSGWLQLPDKIQAATYIIYDLSGKIIDTGIVGGGAKLDIRRLNKGIYIGEVTDGSNQSRFRFVKQ